MKKIEFLTKSQQSRFQEFVEKWTRIGLSTEPADRIRAEAGIRKSYEIGGIKQPQRVVWCGSPFSGAPALVFELERASEVDCESAAAVTISACSANSSSS